MSTITKCDLCGSSEYKPLYQPIGTKREAQVVICTHCSLLYTITQDIPYSREPNPSCDADWGNVRFAKGQRFEVVRGDVLKYMRGNVLDVGSSRGHFVKWARKYPGFRKVVALEPDTRVVDYPLDYGTKIESTALPAEHFDFVYCCQTLEHADSPTLMLERIWETMRYNGVLFVEVPNTFAVLSFKRNLEEYFIDKHNTHFTRDNMGRILHKTGFRLFSVRNDRLNVSLFAEKVSKPLSEQDYWSEWKLTASLVEQYASFIHANRKKVKKATGKVNDILDTGMRVAFWGANTLMDCMVKYGGLDPSRVEMLADDYMADCITHLHGIPIHKSEEFRTYQPETVIILARFNADLLAEKARAFGIRNIVKFYDLL